MATSYHKDVINYLKLNNFHYSENWVIECIDYYKSKEPNITASVLNREVKQQWLLLNLRDMKVPSLPPSLRSQKKISLPGKYVVQVETLVDSGHSRYSQLQTLRNVSLENVKATVNKEEPEAKGRRCLTMSISDGVQELSAMELEFIPQLKLNDPELTPGFKLLITGPVLCRKGMLMLRKENVTILGGEVDVFAQSNSLERVLLNVLGLPDEPTSQIPQTIRGSSVGDDIVNDDLMDVFLDDEEFEVNAINNSVSDESISRGFNRNPQPTLPTTEFTHQPSSSRAVIQPFVSTDSTTDGMFEDSDDIIMCAPDFPVRDGKNALSTLTSSKNSTMFQKDQTKKQTSINQFFRSNDCSVVQKQSNNCIIMPKDVPSTPFVYLSQLISLTLTADTIFAVKAVILTLKTKICVKDDQFTLICKICDGSLSIDVSFASEVLEEMLGFSPCEMAEMVKMRNSNPAVAERLKSAFVSTQNRLIACNTIFHIKFSHNKTTPLVIRLQQLTKEHLIALKARQ